MTPADLILARDGDPDATTAATELWEAVTVEVDTTRAGAALDGVSAFLGADAEVPQLVLGEAVLRAGSYLANSRLLIGFHSTLGEGLPEGDPRVGGYSALRRSGAMSLLTPWSVKRAGAI